MGDRGLTRVLGYGNPDKPTIEIGWERGVIGSSEFAVALLGGARSIVGIGCFLLRVAPAQW